MSTCLIPCLESSPTPSHMPKPICEQKLSFQNKSFLFLKIHYQVSVNILDYPPRRIAGSFFRIVMGPPPRRTVRPLSKTILRKIFLEIPFTTIFPFLFIFMSCTHTYHSRVSRGIWNALCHFQTIDANIFYMYILTKINSHTNHIIHVIQFTINNTKINSHGLINQSSNSFESPKPHKNHKTIHVNSETLGSALFIATQVGISSLDSKILRPKTRSSRPQQISIH